MIIRLLITFLIISSAVGLRAQSILERSVIGSNGSTTYSPHWIISSTVGEVAVNSKYSNSYILSEGFQKAGIFSILDPLQFKLVVDNGDCGIEGDGSAMITTISGCIAPYQIEWSNASNDSLIENLFPGTYSVTVTGFNGCTLTKTFTIATGIGKLCALKFYKGFTPNGDGVNDFWIIDNVEQIKDNTLTIFNRAGLIVNEFVNYNNDNVKWDGGNRNGLPLPNGTYFYVFKSGESAKKGWVELSR